MLKRNKYLSVYRNTFNDFDVDFFNPSYSESIKFDRGAGYFSLKSLILSMEASKFFNDNNISFILSDYKHVLDYVKKGDIVYFDPPYDVESGQNSFVGYTAGGFTRANQKELKGICDVLVQRGAIVGVSNSNTEFIRNLYTEGPYDFYELHEELKVKRTIGATNESRKEITELFILGRKK